MGIFQNLKFFCESSILWVLFSIINIWKHVLTLNYYLQNSFSQFTWGKVAWNMSISGSVDGNFHLEHIVTSTWITIMLPPNFSHYRSKNISPRYFCISCEMIWTISIFFRCRKANQTCGCEFIDLLIVRSNISTHQQNKLICVMDVNLF